MKGYLATFDVATLVRGMVHEQMAIIGSVGATRDDFATAVKRIAEMRRLWSGLLDQMVTGVYPFDQYLKAFHQPGPDSVVTALVFD